MKFHILNTIIIILMLSTLSIGGCITNKPKAKDKLPLLEVGKSYNVNGLNLTWNATTSTEPKEMKTYKVKKFLFNEGSARAITEWTIPGLLNANWTFRQDDNNIYFSYFLEQVRIHKDGRFYYMGISCSPSLEEAHNITISEARSIAEPYLIKNGFIMEDLDFFSHGTTMFSSSGGVGKTLMLSPTYTLRLDNGYNISHGGEISVSVCSDGRITGVSNSLPQIEGEGSTVAINSIQEAFFRIDPTSTGCGEKDFIVVNATIKYYFERTGDMAWNIRPAWFFYCCTPCGGSQGDHGPFQCFIVDANNLKTI
jgi:hypothetical protein